MFIDCSDGTLARRLRVKELIPEFDGARLDDIVDYLTYVFVPIAIAFIGGKLPHGAVGLAIGCLPLLASAYGFAQTEAKTDDHLFTGFPSYWNVVVLYFYLLETTPAFNALVLVVFAVLVFVPIRYAYPSRNPTGSTITFTLGPLWGLVVLYMLVRLPEPSPGLAAVSLTFPGWYLALSAYLTARRAGSAAAGADR
jgi:phosphatidylcholine synthase